jgi:hypothetical protein
MGIIDGHDVLVMTNVVAQEGKKLMPEPVTVGIFLGIAKLFGMITHSAAVHTAAVHTAAVHTAAVHTAAVHTAAVHTAAVHTAAVNGTAQGIHFSLPALLGTTVAVSTFGGITFVKLYGNLLDDLYKEVKRRGRRMPTRFEAKRVLDQAYSNARAQLEAEGFLTPADQREMNKVYWNCLDRQQLALAA